MKVNHNSNSAFRVVRTALCAFVLLGLLFCMTPQGMAQNNRNNNNNNNNNNKKENILKERFKKPTLEEVQSYCLERNNNINAELFIDYYESNGWKVGKNSMKDWKAAVRTWEKKGSTKVDERQKRIEEWLKSE